MMRTAWFISILLLGVCSAQAESTSDKWYLPTKIHDTNTKVSFELDSTWHTVYGAVTNISGEAHLKDPEDPSSIKLTVRFPINSFDTDNNNRDKEMREVMDSEKFPEVVFEGSGLEGGCTPILVMSTGSCEARLVGDLSIRSVKKPVNIPIVIRKADSGFIVKGSYPITWGEFGVKDPSILVAHVDPIVRVDFEVVLK